MPFYRNFKITQNLAILGQFHKNHLIGPNIIPVIHSQNIYIHSPFGGQTLLPDHFIHQTPPFIRLTKCKILPEALSWPLVVPSVTRRRVFVTRTAKYQSRVTKRCVFVTFKLTVEGCGDQKGFFVNFRSDQVDVDYYAARLRADHLLPVGWALNICE